MNAVLRDTINLDLNLALDADALAESRLARHLFADAPVSLRAVDARAPLRGLSDAEAAAILHASPKRIEDFRRGRHVAHRLLRDLDHAVDSLLNDDAGVPRWPRGIVASLSHTQGLAIACGAPAGAVRLLGVDAEPAARRLDRSAWPYVFSPLECDTLSRMPDAAADAWALRLFSLKESAYKATYPLLQRRLALTRIAAAPLHWEPDADVMLTVPGQLPMRGRHCRFGAHVLSAVVVCAAQQPVTVPTSV
jgi:4'-phosphopantetheinyl transferase EntD